MASFTGVTVGRSNRLHCSAEMCAYASTGSAEGNVTADAAQLSTTLAPALARGPLVAAALARLPHPPPAHYGIAAATAPHRGRRAPREDRGAGKAEERRGAGADSHERYLHFGEPNGYPMVARTETMPAC